MPSNVVIEAIAYELPPHVITSLSLEEQITDNLEKFGLQPGNLEGLSGIAERRFWDPGTTPSEVATRAAEKVIDESGINPNEIGCIINTSVSKDYIEPSVACLVHGNLNLSPTCRNYDIGNACLGFVDGIDTLMMMLETRQIKYGLVVNGESSRELIEATLE
ncbi:MAG: 3-oxoacyl-ACP synthase III, partial [Halioglobus sp.]